MTKKDLVRKLTSRKLWAAVVGFVTTSMMAFGANDNQAAQVAGVIMAGGTLIAYIIGEGLTDAAAAGGTDEGKKESGSPWEL